MECELFLHLETSGPNRESYSMHGVHHDAHATALYMHARPFRACSVSRHGGGSKPLHVQNLFC